MKKFLALVMAMVMAFSLMLTVNAANPVKTFDDAGSIEEKFVEAADVLTGMKVFQGDGDGFYPARNITRGEVAALIYRLATGDVDNSRAQLYANYGNFTDVNESDWFAGYVGYCANAGYIKGRTATTFDPYGQVTGYETLAMILRAIGYDKNGEFTGPTWQTNVSALATQLGILNNIKTTHYGDTLYLASRRDVVAELLFQADAKVPMVTYTTAFGYQNTGMTGGVVGTTKNPTLGEHIFGLKDTTRIVLGNQMTGEKGTVLGTEEDGTIAFTTGGGTDAIVNYTMYDYPGTVLIGKPGNVDAGTGNGSSGTGTANTKDIIVVPEGLKLDVKTDLELFGHKVKFWYNKDEKNSDGCYETYAYFDKASKAEYVTVNDNTSANPHPTNTTGLSSVLSVVAGTTLSSDSATDNPTLGYAAKDAGFTVDIGGTTASGGTGNNGSTAYWSDQYSRINAPTALNTMPGKVRTLASATGTANDESPINMYYLVSNNSDKKVDVVVSLNANVGRITEKNTTAAVPNLTLGQSANLPAKPFEANNNAAANKLGPTSNGTINLKQLTADSVQTLGTNVTAWEVKGTSKQTYASTEYDGAGNLNTVALARTDYKYDLKTIDSVTGTVSTFRYQNATPANLLTPTCTITLTDGTVLKQSGMFDSVYANTPNIGQNWASGIAVGATYTFYMDKAGRFLGWSTPSGYEFLYNTFADYGVGNLGTGTIDYAVTGVNWDGDIVTNHVLTRIVIPTLTANLGTPAYAWAPFTAATSDIDFPGKEDFDADGNAQAAAVDRTLAEGYNALPTTKKDLGTAAIGNQISAGMNTGFKINEAGDMDYRVSSGMGIQFLGYYDAGTTVADWTGSRTADTFNWTITKADADRGFIRVYNNTVPGGSAGTQNAYLLDNNTKFIVVTGSGTADLKVDTYTGLKELIGNGTEAIIDVGNAAGTAFNTDADQVWFKTGVDQFGTVLTGNNATIEAVILSDTNLTRYNAQTMFYNFDQTTATGAKLPGADATVEQYRLWNNGEMGYYFIDWSKSNVVAGTAWTAKTDIVADRFYTLTPIDTVNGITVYKATEKALSANLSYDDDFNTNAVTYSYIVVNNLSTGEMTKGNTTLPFNVKDAKVCDVQWLTAQADGTTLAVPRSQITTIEELHNAVSVKNDAGTTQVYTVTVALVNDGSNATTLYIYDIA